MKQKREINKYAQAVFNAAGNSEQIQEVQERMELLLSIYNISSEFRLFLQSRRIAPLKKLKIFNKVFKDILSPIELDLLNHLIENGHIKLLELVIKQFSYICDAAETSLKVIVTTSEELNSKELNKIILDIEQKLDKKIDVNVQVKPEIIGGVKFRIGNKVMDGSIVTRLNKLESSLYQR